MELLMLSSELIDTNILLNESRHMIIPTVLIPFTMLSVGLSVVASFIAARFGYKLNTEGPKQLLEVLFKPRVILLSIVLNLVIWFGYNQYEYYKYLPVSISKLESESETNAQESMRSYTQWSERPSVYDKNVINRKINNLEIKEIWAHQMPKGSFRSGALSGGSYFLGSNDGYIYELDIKSGNELRKFFIGTRVTPGPMIFNNHIYAGEGEHKTHHARVYSFDLKTGKYKNSFETKGHTEGQPIVKSYNGIDQLFIVAGKDGLYALDPISLKKRWHRNSGHSDAAVTVSGRSVFLGTGREKGDSKKIKAFALSYDFKSGNTLWKRELAASSWMPPVLVGSDVCFIMGEIYFKSDLGGVSCFNQVSGRPSATFNTADPVTGIPLVIGKNIYIGDVTGKLCKLSTEDKIVKWCRETGSKGFSFSSPTYDPYRGVIAFATRSKGVFVINPETGVIIKSWMPKDWKNTFASVAVTKGAWLVVDFSGKVRKLSIQ